jgi:hypothetical protein
MARACVGARSHAVHGYGNSSLGEWHARDVRCQQGIPLCIQAQAKPRFKHIQGVSGQKCVGQCQQARSRRSDSAVSPERKLCSSHPSAPVEPRLRFVLVFDRHQPPAV